MASGQRLGEDMQCPQCGADIGRDEWNCASCRINVYWVTQHYDDLAAIRHGQGQEVTARTPSFLIDAHQRAMGERAGRGGGDEHKVRRIARVMINRAADSA